jgi:arylsulfatase
MTHLPAQAAAALGGRSWDLHATIDRPAGAGGVLYAVGNENSGLTVFVKDERLVFDYNSFGDHHVVRSDVEVPVGPSVVGVRFRRGDVGGSATLVVDGAEAGAIEVPFVMLMLSSVGASVGHDRGSAVSPDYAAPFPFEGTLDRVDIDLQTVRPAHAAENAAAAQRVEDVRQ